MKEKIYNECFTSEEFRDFCDDIIKDLKESLNYASVERRLDHTIVRIQDVLINAQPEQKNYLFDKVFSEYENFVKKQISEYYVLNYDKEDLLQEASLCFYNAILHYKIERGVFNKFCKVYIKRNIFNLIGKSRKHIKNNISIIYLDGSTNDDEKNNYDDYLYYQMGNNDTIEDSLITVEQTSEYLNQMDEVLTEKEKISMYMYLQGASYEEIALACNIAGKSVDNSLHRAKTKLKNIYMGK